MTHDNRAIVRDGWGYHRTRIIKRDRVKFKTEGFGWFYWDGNPYNPPKHHRHRMGASLDPLHAYRPGATAWDHAVQRADELEERLALAPRVPRPTRLRRDP